MFSTASFPPASSIDAPTKSDGHETTQEEDGVAGRRDGRNGAEPRTGIPVIAMSELTLWFTTQAQHALEAIAAWRSEAARARRAAAMAELPRRSQARLHRLYLSPLEAVRPEGGSRSQHRAAAAPPRGRRLASLGTTLVTVGAMLLLVVALSG